MSSRPPNPSRQYSFPVPDIVQDNFIEQLKKFPIKINGVKKVIERNAVYIKFIFKNIRGQEYLGNITFHDSTGSNRMHIKYSRNPDKLWGYTSNLLYTDDIIRGSQNRRRSFSYKSFAIKIDKNDRDYPFQFWFFRRNRNRNNIIFNHRIINFEQNSNYREEIYFLKIVKFIFEKLENFFNQNNILQKVLTENTYNYIIEHFPRKKSDTTIIEEKEIEIRRLKKQISQLKKELTSLKTKKNNQAKYLKYKKKYLELKILKLQKKY